MASILHSSKLIDYPRAIQKMEQVVEGIIDGTEEETIWFLQHNHVYTHGTSAQSNELISPNKIPVYNTGRGGRYTYHGPGQRVVYLMLNLNTREKSIRKFVDSLQNWILCSLKEFGLTGSSYNDRIGIWIDPEKNRTLNTLKQEKKIAAIGVRVRKWVTFHGVSINLNPNLVHFDGIIPCGIKEFGVTSFKELGYDTSMQQLDEVLIRNLKKEFLEK